MKNATISIATQEIDLPAGITAGKLRVTISGPVVQTQDIDNDSVVFENIISGEYTVSVSRLDSNENILGTTVTTTFTVPEMYAEPITVSVTLA